MLNKCFAEDIPQSSNTPVVTSPPLRNISLPGRLQSITHHQMEELIGISMHQIGDEGEYTQAEEMYLLIRGSAAAVTDSVNGWIQPTHEPASVFQRRLCR